jgi:cysteine desulfurase
MEQELYYLDHAAATPVDPVVRDAMMPYFSEKFFNPSSPYSAAVEVKREYHDAKARIARCLGVQADELVMTAGATESIHIALTAISGGVAAVGATEHMAVLRAAEWSCGVVIPADKKGRITADAVRKVMHPDITLISVGLVNNELGIIQPIDEIMQVVEVERARRRDVGDVLPLHVHCDASQALALIDVKPKRLGVDLLTLSAAKVYGPKQVGLLWVRPGVSLTPTIAGGGQEMGLRSGTENVAGVVGFAAATELAARRRGAEVKRLRSLRDTMQQTLEQEFPDMVVSSDKRKGLVSFLHVSFPGLDAERLIFMLERQGVMVATGSACAANKGTQSHVLKAIGMSDELIAGSLRISLGRLSTEENVKKATALLVEAVQAERVRVGR